MQQTPLDHWLKAKFAHCTRIYSNFLPQNLPPRVAVREAGEGQQSSHRYCLTPSSESAVHALLVQFQLEGLSYTPEVVEKNTALARWLNRHGRSATCELIWILLLISGIAAALYWLPLAQIHDLVVQHFPTHLIPNP